MADIAKLVETVEKQTEAISGLVRAMDAVKATVESIQSSNRMIWKIIWGVIGFVFITVGAAVMTLIIKNVS